MGDIGKRNIDYIDAFKENLDITFENEVKFSFYLTFGTDEEYTAICKQAIDTIRVIQKREGFCLVEKILLNIKNSPDALHEKDTNEASQKDTPQNTIQNLVSKE